MMLSEHMEQTFMPFLQRNVQFVVDKKIIKKGKQLLFSMKAFYLSFTITNDKGIPKTYEIPYPFKISTKDDDTLILNYEISTLAKENAYATVKITNVPPVSYTHLTLPTKA